MSYVEVDQALAPPPSDERSDEQMTFPFASVVSLPPLPEALQLKALNLIPLPVISTPPAKVEVPVVPVAETVPAVRYSQAARPRAAMVPGKVVVPVPVTERVPVVRVFEAIVPAWTTVEEEVSASMRVVARLVEVALVAERSVKRPVVPRIREAKKLVVVAFVPVELMKVKFWRVDEPERRRLAKVARPFDERVPVVMVFAVRAVAEALTASSEETAIEEPVAFWKVMSWKVEEASESIPPVAVVRPVTPRVEPTVAAPETERLPAPTVPVAKRLVVRMLVAMVVEETVSSPVIRALPVTSSLFVRVEVAAEPMTTTSLVSET